MREPKAFSINIYHEDYDGTSNGWTLEVYAFGRWSRLGVYGTRAAAMGAARTFGLA